MFTFHHPFTMLVSGPSSSGKSTFVKNLLENLDCFVNAKIRKVIWCHAEKNAIPKLKNRSFTIEYVLGVPDEFINHGNEPMLIVLDDLMLEAFNAKISALFTRGSHHKNISVILITQNLFHQGKNSRDISLNAKYIVVFKNPRDKTQFHHLARQIYPENSKELLRVYKEATKTPFSYLLIDLTQGIKESLRFRSNVFEKNYATVYCDLNDLQNREDVKVKALAGEQIYVIGIEPGQL